MKKIALNSFKDSNVGLFILGFGFIFGGILKTLFYFPFTQTGRLYFKLCWFGKFPKFRVITVHGNIITVNIRYGYHNKPEFVEMCEFDLENKTYIEYRNTDSGRQNVMEGTLEEGIKKFT